VPSYWLMLPMANTVPFREGLEALGLPYAVGIQSSTVLWAPGTGPLPPPPRGKMGRPPRLLRRDKQHQPLAAKELALCLTAAELRSMTWREGTRGSMRSLPLQHDQESSFR
jgi:SRSO17 transposase